MIGHLQLLDVNISRNMWRIEASGTMGQILDERLRSSVEEVHPVVPYIKASRRMNLLNTESTGLSRYNFAYCKARTK